MRRQYFLLLFLILFISGTVSAKFVVGDISNGVITVPKPCGNNCTIAGNVLGYEIGVTNNLQAPLVSINNKMYNPFKKKVKTKQITIEMWDYCTGPGCKAIPKTHATVSGGEKIRVLPNLVNSTQPYLPDFIFKDLTPCKKASPSPKIKQESYDLGKNSKDFGTFKTFYGTYNKNELMIYKKEGTFICKAQSPGYYKFNVGSESKYVYMDNSGYKILGDPALALTTQNSAKVIPSSGDGYSVESIEQQSMKKLELGDVVPVILRKKDDFNYSNLKAYGLSPVNNGYKKATTSRGVIWKKDTKSYWFFWPKKSCLGSKPNRVYYNVTNPNKYPELKKSNAWVYFKYTSCGDLKYSKEILNTQKKLFAKSHPTNDAYFYGSYFLTYVTKDSNFGKENPKLVGKEIIFVVSEHPTSSIPVFGLIYNFFSNRYSHDKMYYYIVGIAPPTESDSVEPDSSNTENIDFSDLGNFCSSKGANEDNYFVNFTYDDEEINCSAYSNTGFFCDAEQFAKYAKKTYTNVYNPDKVVKHLKDMLGTNNRFKVFYNTKLATKKGNAVKEIYFAENGLPLTLDPTILPAVELEQYDANDMNVLYLPSWFLRLFLVKDGLCPKELKTKKLSIESTIKIKGTCYVDVTCHEAINALKDLNGWRFEYLISPSYYLASSDQTPLKFKDNLDDPLKNVEVQFYLLLALGENPLEYGMDAVLLKPDDYNLKGFARSNLNVDFRISNAPNSPMNTSPALYLITLDNKYDHSFTAYKSTLHRQLHTYKTSTQFTNSPFDNPLSYLSIDPGYPSHIHSNVPISVGPVESRLITNPTNEKNSNLKIYFLNRDNKYMISHENGYVQIDLPISLKSDVANNKFKLFDILPYTNKNKDRILCYASKDNQLTVTKYSDSDFFAYEKKKQKLANSGTGSVSVKNKLS